MSNMVVRTNVLALNSHRNLGLVGNQQARASARLSSGFRINSAADDAAGLSISEGMRAQIRGMNQASRNAQDGISLIQTAEGYMQTVTEMIQRARELATQAANDTYSDTNRATIANEIEHLEQEVNRIWTTATFNGQNLFSGSTPVGGAGGLDGFYAGDTGYVDALENAFDDIAAIRDDVNELINLLQQFVAQSGTDPNSNWSDFEQVAPDLVETGGTASILGDIAGYVGALEGALNDASNIRFDDDGSPGAQAIGGIILAGLEGALNTAANYLDGSGTVQQTLDALVASLALIDVAENAFNDMVSEAAGGGGGAGAAADPNAGILTGNFFLQVGPDGAAAAGQGHSLRINVVDQVSNLEGNIAGSGEGFWTAPATLPGDAGNHTSWTAAIDRINESLEYVNDLRAALGAYQNRLEFTIENLDIAAENLSASESRIRDADMAMEMMRLTQANILQQAATSMLAQGNQAPQSILQLLG